MRIAEKLVSAAVVALLAAVLALIIQSMTSSALTNYTAEGAIRRDLALTLPLLIGALAGVGAFVMQWTGRSRRRRPRRARATN